MIGGHQRPDIAAKTKQGRADDLLGAVVPSRGYDHADALPPDADLGNVIPFTPRGRKAPGKDAPAVEIAVADRPAPHIYSRERQQQIALLIGGSLLLHGAIFAAFDREPEPYASIGVISVNAELVLGTQTNAGTANTPSESETVESRFSPENENPTATEPEMAPQEVDKQPVEKSKDDVAEKAETATPKAEDALPTEPTPEPEQAEFIATPKPIEKPSLTATPEQKKHDAREAKKVREAARHAKDDGESKRDRAAPASPASPASSGIGRGRSDLDTNYRGVVAAHLARFKQYPSNARGRGDQGTPTVSFSLSGSGSVTSVRLVRGSGVASIDGEATAMVRRASPFPPPPSGRPQSFTVPINFHLR